MIIRRAKKEDLSAIFDIYHYARNLMKMSGNPYQWGDNRPSNEAIVNDLIEGNLYLVVSDDEILGAFSFVIGVEPTYRIIYDGKWLNDENYGVIHKVAASGKRKGIMNTILDYCETQIDNIRIDTHNDNKIMQHILEKREYVRCGIIYVDDGSARIAYQRKSKQ